MKPIDDLRHVHFDDHDLDDWLRRLGDASDPVTCPGYVPIEPLPDGGIDCEVAMQCGLYIIVDAWNRVLYVGKVQRHDSGLDARLRNHHREDSSWAGVWVIPLRADLSPGSIRDLERSMIEAYCPPLNVEHNRMARRNAP